MIGRVFHLLSAKLGTIHQTTNTRPTKNFMPNNTLYFYKNGKTLKYIVSSPVEQELEDGSFCSFALVALWKSTKHNKVKLVSKYPPGAKQSKPFFTLRSICISLHPSL